MTSRRQRVVKFDTVDESLATFVADVVELGGLFRRVADDIARREGQTQTVWYALSVYSAGPLTVPQAARRLGTTRQAVQRTTNDLLERGLATSSPNPDHRASPLVGLTLDGHEVLARISAAASRERRGWFSDHDATALHAAHDEVRRLRDVLRDHAREARDPGSP